MKSSFATFSRFLVSLVFLAGAVKNIFSWHEAENSLLSALLEWQSHFVNMQEIQVFFSFLMSWSSILLGFAIFFSLFGGLFILLGVKEKIGLCFLILFLIPATFLFHPFWWVDGALQETQMVMFFKNMAILGCMFLFLLSPSQSQEIVYDEPQAPTDDYSSMGY